MSKKFRKQKKLQTEQAKVAESTAVSSALETGLVKAVAPGMPKTAAAAVNGKIKAGTTARQRRNQRIAQEQVARFTALFGEDVCNKIAPSDRAAFFSRLKLAEEQGDASPDIILRQMIDRRTLYRSAGETLINAYPGLDFRRMTAPLTVGTGDFLVKQHPAIPSEFIWQFLSWVTSRPCYIDMIARGVPRRSLDGNTVEPVLEEHRKNAVLSLKRAARGPHKKVASFRSFRYFYKKIPGTLGAA